MQRVIKFADLVNKIVGYILAIMMGIMSVMVIIQVFNRSFFNFSLYWTEELTRYLMIYIVFLGSSIAVRQKKMISIELLPQMFTDNKRKFISVIVLLLSIGFYMIMLYWGIQILDQVKEQASPGMGLSMAIPYASIPIGGFLLALNAFALIIDELTSRGKGG
ncbi:TRAP transporter small permease [Aeribacillus sp. FSL K6-8394]|uniref:TRAP transporter small permease n=1 Tax=Aeribacillus sp. FSL K6-8394 TaxID=2954570 RepID=UPI0030F85FCF